MGMHLRIMCVYLSRKEWISMYETEMNLDYPVEYLVFQLENVETIQSFVQLDHEIWTMFLKEYPDFVSKEVWVNDTTPGEVHSIIVWKTLDGWKSIPIEKLKQITAYFDKQYPYPYKIVRRLHKENEHGLCEYCHYGVE